MPPENFYEILKVRPDAPPEVVGASYRALAKMYHPDVNSSNPRAALVMRKLNVAWEILGNSASRARYDALLNRSSAVNAAVNSSREVDVLEKMIREDPELGKLVSRLAAERKKARDNAARVVQMRPSKAPTRSRREDADLEEKEYRQGLFVIAALLVIGVLGAGIWILRTPGYRAVGFIFLLVVVGALSNAREH